MSDLLKNNPAALRHCLLYEFLRVKAVEDRTNEKSSIFAKYENFCEVIGDGVMKYSEFEFWFCRFANGEFDLNYEKDEEKKTYELMDMPIDVMRNVVKYLDIFDQANLIDTSRSLRTFVENQKLPHDELRLCVSYSIATVSLGESVYIQYTENLYGCAKNYKNRETSVEGVYYWEHAIRDIKTILKNPKLFLDTLAIELYGNKGYLYKDLVDALKFTHHLNVKNLILEENSSYLLATILPQLKPGYLETINIVSDNPNVNSMKKVFKMKQWKQTQRFFMDETYFIGSLHHLFHFKEFTVALNQFSMEDVRQIKEVFFKSPHFEKCSLTLCGVIDMFIFDQEFGNALREDPYIYHYPIPNSADYFEIIIVGRFFEVTRKKN